MNQCGGRLVVGWHAVLAKSQKAEGKVEIKKGRNQKDKAIGKEHSTNATSMRTQVFWYRGVELTNCSSPPI